MNILIDNYDSFSYNLYQILGAINPDIKVLRNDELTCVQISELNPEHIILSPGPGKPCDSGVCPEVIKNLSGKIPILGICLGHQAIFEAFGGTVSYAPTLMHGKASEISIDQASPIFKGLPPVLRAARYHSLSVVNETLPDCLAVTAKTADGIIMAVQHKKHQTYGLQFHPESILTEHGKEMLGNFLHSY